MRQIAVTLKHCMLTSAIGLVYCWTGDLALTASIVAIGVFGMAMDYIERQCMEREKAQECQHEHITVLASLETRLASAERSQALNGAAQAIGDR